jgi:hypothetical protein
MNNRPVCGSSSETQSHPIGMNNNNNNDLSGNAQLMKNVKSRTRRHLPDKHLEGRM